LRIATQAFQAILQSVSQSVSHMMMKG